MRVELPTEMWLEPSPVTGPANGPLAPGQVAGWRDHGAAVVDRLVPLELIAAARSAIVATLVPSEDGRPGDFGSSGQFVFPAECEALNAIALHPALLSAVAQLLDVGVRDVRLTQADLW